MCCLILYQYQHIFFCTFIFLASFILSQSLAEPSPSCLLFWSQQKVYCKLQRNLNTFLRTPQNDSSPVLKDHLTIRIGSTSRQHPALSYPMEMDSSSKQPISSVRITCHVWRGRLNVAFTSLRTQKPFSYVTFTSQDLFYTIKSLMLEMAMHLFSSTSLYLITYPELNQIWYDFNESVSVNLSVAESHTSLRTAWLISKADIKLLLTNNGFHKPTWYTNDV